MNEDHTKPINLTDTLFRMDLPGVSNITPSPSQTKTPAQSKYEQPSDDDPLDINLNDLLVSKIQKKNSTRTATSSNVSSPSQSPSSKQLKKVTIDRPTRRKPLKKQPNKAKAPQVDLDLQIGEVAEWAQRKANNAEQEQDFEQTEKVGQSKQQLEKRRRLEQKLKKGLTNNNQAGGLGGLKAKAEQLARQNELKRQLSAIAEKEEEHMKDSAPIPQPKQQKQHSVGNELSKNESDLELIVKVPELGTAKAIQHTEEKLSQDLDDHWDKINEGTLQEYNQKQQKRKQLNFETVTRYYREEFNFDEADIDEADIGTTAQQKQQQSSEQSFIQLLCACFSEKKKARKEQYNAKLAKRLVAISKKQMQNGQQQFWLLRQIWVQLTDKPFGRHGAHWNQIGFQGRDPATDLRSTGVLSLLQWLQFIENHPKQSHTYHNWSTETDFPLALTHIKATGVFLSLLAQGKVSLRSWQEAQRGYNCLIISVFRKMISSFKVGQTIGTLVEQTARDLKKQYEKTKNDYNKEFKLTNK